MAASTAPASKSGLYADPREDWLAQHAEEVIDPRDRSSTRTTISGTAAGCVRYMIEDMAADIASGHNIVATVYVDCRSMLPRQRTGSLSPRRRVEFANGVAAMSASGGYGPAQDQRRHRQPCESVCSATAQNRCWKPRSLPATAVSRHPAFLGLGRRARGSRHVCDAAKGLFARPDLSQGLCLPRAARPQL